MKCNIIYWYSSYYILSFTITEAKGITTFDMNKTNVTIAIYFNLN